MWQCVNGFFIIIIQLLPRAFSLVFKEFLLANAQLGIVFVALKGVYVQTWSIVICGVSQGRISPRAREPGTSF